MVDEAHILSGPTKANLESKLADLEQKSTIQFVVATVPSLGGQEIEPYANDLFRYWKLGQADKNNGVLFLIAPNQRRVRIEVGYGLEGTLTDAISKIIIANAAAPRFKTGDFDGGVTRATDDIITTLTTDSAEWQGKPDFRAAHATQLKDGDSIPILMIIVIFILIFIMVWILCRRIWRNVGGGGIVPIDNGGWPSGGSSSSVGASSDDSGFSGGGGSSGGGGASGDW